MSLVRVHVGDGRDADARRLDDVDDDQRRRAEACGGKAAILERGAFVYTPPPGEVSQAAG